MNDLCKIRRDSAIVEISGLAGLDEKKLCDFLWDKIGLNVAEEHCSVSPHINADRATVVLTRECLADFFGRALEGQLFAGMQPKVSASLFLLPVEQQRRLHQEKRNERFRSKVLTNKNGIQRLVTIGRSNENR